MSGSGVAYRRSGSANDRAFPTPFQMMRKAIAQLWILLHLVTPGQYSQYIGPLN